MIQSVKKHENNTIQANKQKRLAKFYKNSKNKPNNVDNPIKPVTRVYGETSPLPIKPKPIINVPTIHLDVMEKPEPANNNNIFELFCKISPENITVKFDFLQHIKHPISVARKVMDETPHVMLSGEGALQFALEQGFPKEDLLTEKAEKRWKEWLKESEYKPIINVENHDTIGLLALDKKGDISGACTTSGLSWKMHGRVGDSPVIGAGMYVDNEVGGCCATGVGEAVLKTLGSFLIVELMRQGASPQEACEEGIARIVKNQNYKDMQIGYLAINKKGEHGAYAVHPWFNYALHQGGENRMIDSLSYLK